MAAWLGGTVSLIAGIGSAAESSRVTHGLVALYPFSEGKGSVVTDQSGAGKPLNLMIEESSAARWVDGGLQVSGSVRIQSQGGATALASAVKRTNELTLEAWIRPTNTKQNGPARIVSISDNPSQRNVTLGQDGDFYDVRLRTTKTSTNGIPSTSASRRTATVALTHVVYTFDRAGNGRLFVNGQQRGNRRLSGDLRNWANDYRLILANEATGDRPWMGSFHLLAIYARALDENEVLRNYRAGSRGEHAAASEVNTKAVFFEQKIAPLLAEHCLDCHDSAARKGGLDLSRKDLALAGGESGPVIVPGKSAESLLWEAISSGDMPPDGEGLTEDAKSNIRQWLDQGATWSLARIDPVLYLHGHESGTQIIRRLTVNEYIATVLAATGVDITSDARRLLPPDVRADGFSNTAYNLNVDLKHVESYARLAEIIASRMDVLEFARRFSSQRSLNTDASMRKFVAAMGKWLLRGPLDEREVTNYCGIGTTVSSAGGDYEDGVRLIIESMLQSPRFIYRIENQRGDGLAWPVSQYELASRMSYIIWGAPPDADLMKAADEGKLADTQQVREQARRMLRDPRAIDRSAQFINDWLNLDRLEIMTPNEERFPTWRPELGRDMRQETLAYFREVAWEEQRPLHALFNAQFTFATPALAKHYGLQPRGEGLQRYDLSTTDSRGGLLTQGAILTVGGDDASMVTRGLFVLHDILRGTVKDPPPGLDTTPVPSKPGLPQRLIAEKRINNEACGGCHARFEPLAFALEKYDGIGAFHERDEHGNQLREDGEILFPGEAKSVEYKTANELMDRLAENDRTQRSLTWKVAQFSLGRPLGAAEARTVDAVHDRAAKAGGSYADVIEAIVTSDLVMLGDTEPN